MSRSGCPMASAGVWPKSRSCAGVPLDDDVVGVRDEHAVLGLLDDRRQPARLRVDPPQPVGVEAEQPREHEEAQRARDVAGRVGLDVAGLVADGEQHHPDQRRHQPAADAEGKRHERDRDVVEQREAPARLCHRELEHQHDGEQDRRDGGHGGLAGDPRSDRSVHLPGLLPRRQAPAGRKTLPVPRTCWNCPSTRSPRTGMRHVTLPGPKRPWSRRSTIRGSIRMRSVAGAAGRARPPDPFDTKRLRVELALTRGRRRCRWPPMAAQALLFPGQGSHTEGMDEPHRGAPLFERGLELLGYDPFDDLAAGTRTQQPALFLCPWRPGTRPAGPMRRRRRALAGRVCGARRRRGAGVRGRRAAGRRARSRDGARGAPGAGRHGGHARRGPDAVQALGTRLGLVVANDNAPGQLVLSGPLDAVQEAAAVARDEADARARLLDVGGAFHSPLMEPAAALEAALADTPVATARFPVTPTAPRRPSWTSAASWPRTSCGRCAGARRCSPSARPTSSASSSSAPAPCSRAWSSARSGGPGMKAGVFGIGAAVPHDVVTNAHFEAAWTRPTSGSSSARASSSASGSTAARPSPTWPSTPARTRWPTPGAAPTRSTG